MKIRSHHKISLIAGTLLLLIALAGASGNVFAQGTGYDEKEALSIDRSIMCPVCPAETIDQAQVEISRQMKAVIREMLSQGASRDEILEFFVARYGQGILAAPPKSGVNLLVWVLPIAGVLAALAGGYLIIRSMSSRGSAQVAGANILPADPADTSLEPFLEAVDRDLALMGEGETATRRESNSATNRASNNHRNSVDKLREHETNRGDDLTQNG